MLALWLMWIVRIIIVAVVGLFAAPFLWEKISSDSFMTVTGRSMEPAYHVGDVISVLPPTGHDLEVVGESVVVAFKPGDASTQYIHRIHELTSEGARLKGDNNTIVDPGEVSESDVMGTPRFVLTGWNANLFHLTQSWIARGVLAAVVVTIIFLPGSRPGKHRGDAPKPMRFSRRRSAKMTSANGVKDGDRDPAPKLSDDAKSVFADLFHHSAVGCAAVIAVLMVVAGSEPVSATAQPAPSQELLFEVTPESELFNVTLSPGDTEFAVATVTNRSAAPLTLVLGAETSSWVGDDNPSDHIMLGARAADGCEDAVLLPLSTTISAVGAHPLGVLDSGAVAQVCVAAGLPVETALSGSGTALVHFHFTGIVGPDGGDPAGGLPGTGLAVSWNVVLAMFVAVALGILLTQGRGTRRRQGGQFWSEGLM